MPNKHLELYTAFADTHEGGNPAGVWLGDELPTDEAMLRIAADVGYSETVFATPTADQTMQVRYFSPKAEVPFCGHATIALGARLAQEHGTAAYLLHTNAGEVALDVEAGEGAASARLTSVAPSSRPADPALTAEVLRLLDWTVDELDPSFSPTVAFAGANHLILAAATRQRLRRVDYDFDQMRSTMEDNDLTTVSLIWQETKTTIHSRNLFPIGGVVEDPATGAAAAALGGRLRDLGRAPTTITVHQGDDMGRPSVLTVHIPPYGGIQVSGQAVPIPH